MDRTMRCMLVALLIVGCGFSGSGDSKDNKVLAQNVNSLATLNNDYYAEGIKQLKNGNVQQAVIDFERQVRDNPKDVRAYSVLGNIYMKAGKLHEAKIALEIAANLDQQSAEIYFSLTQCYDRMGERAKAVESITKSMILYRQAGDEENFKRSAAILQVFKSQAAQSQAAQ
ncbi:MAG: hypothetical protein ABH858_05085 [Candidatus Omnitrophota bacterium]